ncbi:MAG: hypothetical protein WA374_06205, partial [Acidobacteriaceae bacterium]
MAAALLSGALMAGGQAQTDPSVQMAPSSVRPSLPPAPASQGTPGSPKLPPAPQEARPCRLSSLG